MPIQRMISHNPDELREFQQRLTRVGKIRLGVYETPAGQRGRPKKIDTFRFTSPDQALIRAVAAEYGGDVQEWKPQGGKAAQWEVITAASAVPVYLVNGQRIDPNYELWAGGRTCVRRCDGVWNRAAEGEPCICNGPNRPSDPKQLCKITLRVQVMLRDIPGIGSWMIETHGENAVQEISVLAGLVSAAPMPIPAMLRLRLEERRNWNPDKRGGAGYESRSFYVPWFDISALTAQQVAIGGDALTQALEAADAPAAISAAPVSAVPAIEAPPAPAGPAPGELLPGEDARILAAIEGADLELLEMIKTEMARREIRDPRIMQAWVSRQKGLLAMADLARASRDDLLAAADALPPEKREKLHQLVADAAQRPPTPGEAAWTPPGVDGDMFEGPVETVDAEIVDEPGPIAREPQRRADTIQALAEHPATVAAVEAGQAAQRADGDVDAWYMQVTSLLGQRGVEATAKVNEAICAFAKVERASQANADQLAAFASYLKDGGAV